MELLILNKNFEAIKVVDDYYSAIWTDRYMGTGDFELYISMHPGLTDYIKTDYYIHLADSRQIMIIEDIEMHSNEEDGVFLTVTGRSLLSLLTRRIVWKHTVLTGSLQEGLLKLLNENAISPTDNDRVIDNLVFQTSDNERIMELEHDAQYHGEELYDIILAVCTEHKIGAHILLNEDNQFIFELYDGVDHSYDQLTNPYVVFSPEFDNIKSNTYREINHDVKTVGLVGGEGEGNDRTMATVTKKAGAGTGIYRREAFIGDGGSSTNGEGGKISAAAYKKQLEKRGLEELAKRDVKKMVEAGADIHNTFVYGVDFGVGDIIQLETEYGFKSPTRLTEIVFAQDMNGLNVYPTFASDEEE